MLATNSTFYRRVLRLDIAKDDGSASVDWAKFFDRGSAYRLLYTLQIVQAVLEDGETDSKRCNVLNSDDFPTFKVAGMSPANDDEQNKGEDNKNQELLQNDDN